MSATPTCAACGMQWTRTEKGRAPRFCPTCIEAGREHATSYNKAGGFDLALTVVNQRIAIELATSLLEMGKAGEALEILYIVEAPRRNTDSITGGATCQEVCQRRNHADVVFEVIACTLPAGHFYAQRHEGTSATVGHYTWDAAVTS